MLLRLSMCSPDWLRADASSHPSKLRLFTSTSSCCTPSACLARTLRTMLTNGGRISPQELPPSERKVSH
eukprot:5797559-Alexandrium_andersonii.AAC.1